MTYALRSSCTIIHLESTAYAFNLGKAELTKTLLSSGRCVHSVYEKIAPYFNGACYKAWPKVQQLISEQEPGGLVADIDEWGCGNDRNLHISSQVYKMRCNYCFPLLESARNEVHELKVCHGLCLPYQSECFYAVLAISVIHHFSTEERRMRAIKEMARILRVGGQIMIYVWAMEQKQRGFEKQDVFVPWNPSAPSCSSGEPCSHAVQKSVLHKDKELALNQPHHKADSRWVLGGAWLRHHRVFKEGALAELTERHIPELHITHSYFNGANWCVIAEKTEMWKI
ncbi:probable tRNA methyltransferase 9B [Patagioenas fasciata]|uniref:probable tRNA methyltransferase 9B n=1 Tax=Patagioenas fasciata TaxID=372321 RepID=UPI003A9911AA